MIKRHMKFSVPAAVCDEILAVASVAERKIDAKVEGKDSPAHELRKTDICWLPHGWYDGVMTDFGMTGNAEWQFDVTGGEDIQVGWYGEGGHYKMHPDVDVFNRDKGYHRKVTVVLCLFDDYEGGELELDGVGKMRLAKGDGVVFPSFLPHMVHPVTSGLRVTAVKWLIGGFFR